MNILLLPLLLSVGDALVLKPDMVVVCPAEFRSAMQPWVAHRQQQGHVIQFLAADGNALQIRDHIRSIAKDGTLKFVVLVGDPPPPQSDDLEQARGTPTFRLPSQIGRHWGGDADFVSDNPYADLDDDGVPELAIGRLTAHTPDELRTIIKKILAYEQSRDFGPWRRRINFVSGEGGFGTLLDSALENVARSAIGCDLPPAYQSTLTDAVWRSPFCPDPHQFHKCSLERMNEGCLFWVFMGHGAPRTLQWAMFPDGRSPILRCEDCAKLHCGATPPIALCMCCFTGDFGEEDDCLAQELLKAQEGPVAVLAGSNVTLPYGMAAMARQAVHEYFDSQCETLGEWLLQAKRDTMTGYDLPIWSLLHAAMVAAAPAGMDFKQERWEQLQLFNLFGDPTLPLARPQDVKISLPETAIAGESLTIRAQCPVTGSATVELVRPFDRLQASSRDLYDGSLPGRGQFESLYKMVNNVQLASATAQCTGGGFSAVLAVPDLAPGKYYLRSFVQGDDDFALGSSVIQIAVRSDKRDNSAEPKVAARPAGSAINKIQHRP
jgi:Peptidase family C25